MKFRSLGLLPKVTQLGKTRARPQHSSLRTSKPQQARKGSKVCLQPFLPRTSFRKAGTSLFCLMETPAVWIMPGGLIRKPKEQMKSRCSVLGCCGALEKANSSHETHQRQSFRFVSGLPPIRCDCLSQELKGLPRQSTGKGACQGFFCQESCACLKSSSPSSPKSHQKLREKEGGKKQEAVSFPAMNGNAIKTPFMKP